MQPFLSPINFCAASGPSSEVHAGLCVAVDELADLSWERTEYCAVLAESSAAVEATTVQRYDNASMQAGKGILGGLSREREPIPRWADCVKKREEEMHYGRWTLLLIGNETIMLEGRELGSSEIIQKLA